ncbi:MAG: DUF6318 family protein [Ornithinimicrobium sp.]
MRVLSVVVLSLALGGLAGCSEEKASPPPTPEDSVGATSDEDTATASSGPDDASSTSAPVADPGIPQLPPEAMEDSEAGAEAFAQFYMDLANYIGENPQSGILERYSNEGCSTCDVFEAQAEEFEANGNYYTGPAGIVQQVSALSNGAGYVADLDISVPAYRVLSSSGDVVETQEAGAEIRLEFDLVHDRQQFYVDEIYSVED